MVVVKKYPSAYSVTGDPSVWINPANILGAPDSSCAICNNPGGSSNRLYVSDFGFAIPADATITRVTVGGFAEGYVDNQGIIYVFGKGAISFTDSFYDCSAGLLCTCSDANARERSMDIDLSILPLTPDDMNNETFFFYWWGSAYYATYIGYVDACYIEVEYTVPAPAPAVTLTHKIDHGAHPRSRCIFKRTLKLKPS